MTTTLRRTIPLAAAVAALFAFAPAAFATRYATPSPAPGADCHTEATACDIVTAVEGVAGNKPVFKEEIVVAPGTYDLPQGKYLVGGAGSLNVHGVEGQPRPVIVAHGTYAFHSTIDLTYLEIDSDVYALGVDFSKLDRLIIKGRSADGEPVCQCYSGSVTNSLVVALPGSTGQGAGGVNSNGASPVETLRNDTFISQSATAPALRVDQISNGNIDYKGYNVIARNTAGGTDVSSTGPGTKLTLTHSNFVNAQTAGGGAIIDGGGNVPGAPVFVDAANGDYHQAPGSPTIDAGLDDALNGPVDLAGDPRKRDAATDIGAFEDPAPPAQPSQPPASGGGSPESPAPTTSTDGGSPSGGDAGTAPATDASAPVATPAVAPATATPTVAKRCVKRTVTVRRHGKRVHVKKCVSKKQPRKRARRHHR